MIEWKDTSIYSRDDKERKPNAYALATKAFKIHLHRHIHHPPATWLVSCYELGISQKVLKHEELELAKREAIEAVQAKIGAFTKASQDLR